jgi:hypothetical protein
VNHPAMRVSFAKNMLYRALVLWILRLVAGIERPSQQKDHFDEGGER